MRWRRRVKAQHDQLAVAVAERERSEQRREAIHKHVIRPLQETARRNQFADLIRASLEGPRQ